MKNKINIKGGIILDFKLFKGRKEEEEEYGLVDEINLFREELSISETNWKFSTVEYDDKDDKLNILQWKNSNGDAINIKRSKEDGQEFIRIHIVKADSSVEEIGSFNTKFNESSKELFELAIKRASMFMENSYNGDIHIPKDN